MRSKKAAWVGTVLHPVFELFVAVFVMMALLWFVYSLDEKTSFEKRFLANDLGLILDAIPSMPQPGNLFLIYTPPQSKKFSLEYGYRIAKEPAVEVFIKPDDRQPEKAYFTPDPAISVQPKELQYSGKAIVPVFLKRGNRILFENSKDVKASFTSIALACDGPQFSGKLIVTPVHTTGNEASAEQAVAQTVQGSISLMAGGPDSVLAIKIGSTPADKIFIKAYVNGENDPALLAQSQRLGCEIANAVLKEWENNGVYVTGIAVIPINPDQTATADDKVIEKGKVGVLIELGTLQRKGLFDDLSQQQAAAMAISGGIANA